MAEPDLLAQDCRFCRMIPCVCPPGPCVGQHATRLVGTDCYPYEVIAVKSPTRCTVRRMKYLRTDKNGNCGPQLYMIYSDAQGQTVEISKRTSERWVRVGERARGARFFLLGLARAYRDPHF